MLRIHQPYIKKRKIKYFLALASIGAFLLGSFVIGNIFSETSTVQAAEIRYMQQFTNPICQSMSAGDTMDLIDPRGESEEDFQTYKIIKMLDDTCWMAENLRLVDATIYSANSDITSGSFTIPESSISGFKELSAMDGYAPKVYYDNDSTYGAYYNWYTATAGSGNSNIDGTASRDIANSSICPKGWKLPAYDGPGSFYNIVDGINGYKGDYTVINGKDGHIFGYESNNAFWPAAGNIRNGSLNEESTEGYYWSRKASSSSAAHALSYRGSAVYSQFSNIRYYGSSVRCVADPTVTTSDFTYEGDIYWEESKDGNVVVNMPSILTIDAVSEFEGVMDASNLLEGSISATIFSNTAYDVLMNANTDAALVSAEGNRIEPVSPTNEVKAGNNAWGFWDGVSEPKLYTVPLSTEMKSIPNVESDGDNDTTKHTYYLGISIAPSLPSGVYATDVTVTAAAK